MKPSNKTLQPTPPRGLPPILGYVKSEKQKAQTAEVAGRHKNDGQKDHKGAR